MRIQRLRLELRMKLASKKPRMIGQLDYLDKLSVRRFARENKPVPPKLILVTRIELIAMSVTLADLPGTVGPLTKRAFLQHARVCSQPHGAAHRLDSDQIA